MLKAAVTKKKVTVETIGKRLSSGKLSYIDALTECELAGIEANPVWGMRETLRILSLPRTDDFTAFQAAKMLEASGLPVPKNLTYEAALSARIKSDEVIHVFNALDMPNSISDLID